LRKRKSDFRYIKNQGEGEISILKKAYPGVVIGIKILLRK